MEARIVPVNATGVRYSIVHILFQCDLDCVRLSTSREIPLAALQQLLDPYSYSP